MADEILDTTLVEQATTVESLEIQEATADPDLTAKIGTIDESKYGKMKHISIVAEMRRSYLDYAMSVIVARALPDVRDGMKPVHRRILYSMYKSGIHHTSSYKKAPVSWETCWDVIIPMAIHRSIWHWFALRRTSVCATNLLMDKVTLVQLMVIARPPCVTQRLG